MPSPGRGGDVFPSPKDLGPDTRRKKPAGESHAQFPHMRSDVRPNVSDRSVDLTVEYIPWHPSVVDEPGVFSIYEPLHALLHVCVSQGSAHTGHKSIQPLRLQAEVDVLVVQCREEHN